MALKIFGNDPAEQPKPRQSFKDDVVGRFRAGHMLNNRPVSLTEWRITTGDPEIADRVFDLFGGDAPQKYETKGEDDLEVFTATKEVEVIVESAEKLRQEMVQWSRNGKLIQRGDGETISYPPEKVGPDPDAALSFNERKAKGSNGTATGPDPQIELFFRLAAEPDLGIFKLQSSAWGLAKNLAAEDVAGQLAEVGGPAKVILALEYVEFTAKNGPRAGQLVSYTQTAVKVVGPADVASSEAPLPY